MYFVIQPLLVKKLCLYLIEISVEKVPAETHLQFLYRKKTSSVKCLFCIIILVITQGRLSNMKEKQVIICNCNIRLMQKYLYFCIVELCPLYWHTLFNKCDYVIKKKKLSTKLIWLKLCNNQSRFFYAMNMPYLSVCLCLFSRSWNASSTLCYLFESYSFFQSAVQ